MILFILITIALIATIFSIDYLTGQHVAYSFYKLYLNLEAKNYVKMSKKHGLNVTFLGNGATFHPGCVDTYDLGQGKNRCMGRCNMRYQYPTNDQLWYIGCRSKTLKGWDYFFSDESIEEFESPRSSLKFRAIKEYYFTCKAHYLAENDTK